MSVRINYANRDLATSATIGLAAMRTDAASRIIVYGRSQGQGHVIYILLGLFVCLSVRPSVRLSVCLSLCLSVCLSVRLSVCMSVCLSVCLYVCLSVCLSVSLSLCLYVRHLVRFGIESIHQKEQLACVYDAVNNDLRSHGFNTISPTERKSRL